MFSNIELAHVYNLKIDNDFALFRNRMLMADTGFKREILGRVMQIFIDDLWIVCQHGLSQMDTNDNTARIFLLLSFSDLSHHRTCRSAYGGFGLSHLTMCGKLFSAIPLTGVTSIPLSDSVLSSE